VLKCIKIIFLFLKLTYQNDPKHIKKLSFSKKINLLRTSFAPRFQTVSKKKKKELKELA